MEKVDFVFFKERMSFFQGHFLKNISPNTSTRRESLRPRPKAAARARPGPGRARPGPGPRGGTPPNAAAAAARHGGVHPPPAAPATWGILGGSPPPINAAAPGFLGLGGVHPIANVAPARGGTPPLGVLTLHPLTLVLFNPNLL